MAIILNQGHVMVPAAPTADWIVPQADVLFTGLQGAFHPVVLPLHERQAGDRGRGGGVAQAVFEFVRRGDCPAHHQGPQPGLGFLAIPQPDPLMEHFHLQRPFRAVPPSDPLPNAGWLLLRPLVDAQGRGLCLCNAVGGRPRGRGGGTTECGSARYTR